MKTFLKLNLILVVLIIPLFSPMVYSQDKTKSLKPKSTEVVAPYSTLIDSLRERVYERIASGSTKDIVFDSLDLNTIKRLARIMYNTPVKKPTGEAVQVSSEPIKQGVNEAYFWSKIIYSMTLPVFGLIRTAYLLKIRATSVKIDSVSNAGGSFTVVIGTIEDVYKGGSVFKANNTITFYFMNNWSKVKNNFTAGKEYLVPLEPRGKFMNFDNSMALIPYLDDSHGYHPIEDGYLIDKYNFFGFGEKVKFNIFDKKLRERIKEIKSW